MVFTVEEIPLFLCACTSPLCDTPVLLTLCYKVKANVGTIATIRSKVAVFAGEFKVCSVVPETCEAWVVVTLPLQC